MAIDLNSLDDVSCLVVEPSHSFATVIQTTLQNIGFRQGNILFAKDFAQAEQYIDEHSPNIVVSEYEIQRRYAFELSQRHKAIIEDPYDCVFFIISGNSGHVAVAESAEEDIDGYLLKPFSQGVLEERLKQVIHDKANPSPYHQKIRIGKEHLLYEEYDQAKKCFFEATNLSTEPALALYYAGHVHELLGEREGALECFRKGIKLKSLHYKCLLGLFYTLFEMKKYDSAYEVSRKLVSHYPVTPKRLGKFFITAVYTYQFDDIPNYYEIYKEFEHRPAELVKIMSAATLAGGKYFLKKGLFDKAAELLEMGTTISGRDEGYIQKGIRAFLDHQRPEEARLIFQRMDRDFVGSPLHSQLNFVIDAQELPLSRLLMKGKEIIERDHANEEVFELVVDKYLELGKTNAAESVACQAVQKYPEMRGQLFEKIQEVVDEIEALEKSEQESGSPENP